VLIENPQGFKTFWVYFKALFENYLKSSIYFLKNFFEKDRLSKYYFLAFNQPYASLLAKEMSYKVIYKVFYAKECLKNIFQKLFCKSLFLDLKGLFLKP
jgi:hypothetical protein